MNDLLKATLNFLGNILRDESGQDVVEYALIGCAVGLGVVAALVSVPGGVKSIFAHIGTSLSSGS